MRTEAVLEPLRREVQINENLFARRSIPEIEVLRLRGELAEREGDLGVLAASQLRSQASIAEIETQITTARSSYELTARERSAVVLADLAVVEESLRAARDRVSSTALRAPVRGTVNEIHVRNVGGVAQPGMVLAEIVPVDDTLRIEAEMSPRDVAFVRVGAEASVKISAYDYLRYGDLKAVVERIGADTFLNAAGEPYFRVVLRTSETALYSDGSTLEISPGMIANVDIKSGSKTVLDFLIQPVLRAQYEALRER